MTRSLESIHDELLVLRCQSGETEALEELIRSWQPRLWRHARRLTGRVDAAWDVLQETLLAIVRSLHRLDDPALFRTWAYRIASQRTNPLIGCANNNAIASLPRRSPRTAIHDPWASNNIEISNQQMNQTTT